MRMAEKSPEIRGFERRAARLCFGVEARVADHLFDGLDARDRLLRKGKAERDGAEQLAVDIDGAAAHALQDAGLSKRAAGQLRQDDDLFGADITEHAENFELEILNAASGKDGSAGTAQPGVHVA